MDTEASSAPLPAIRLARTGTFTSNEGVQVSFSAADLASAAAAYDPVNDPAPLVIGHPRLDDPAYGWVAGLAVQDGELVAQPDRVEASFAEAVREGRYAKVSARFWGPDHPANPAPGSWYLKHIGFLGAHAPGIKGLGTVQFADGADDGAVTLDLPTNSQEPTMTQKAGASASDEVSFAERAAALETREQELAARELQISQREEADRKRAAEARHDEHVSFAEGLVNDAKLAPAGKELVVGLLDHFDATAVVSFGEAGDLSPALAFRQLLDGAAPLIDLGERGGKPKGAPTHVSFAAPEGYEVDPEQAALHAAATKLQQGNPELTWMDAVRRAKAAG